MSQHFQPRYGRGRRWGGNKGRGRGRGGYRGRGRGRARGRIIKREGQRTASWKLLEPYPKDKNMVVHKSNDDQLLAISNGPRINTITYDTWDFEWSSIESIEPPFLYNVQTNKWTQFTMEKSKYRLIFTTTSCINTETEQMYIAAEYVNKEDYAILQFDHEKYEQYKIRQNQRYEQNKLKLDRELEQKVQEKVQQWKGGATDQWLLESNQMNDMNNNIRVWEIKCKTDMNYSYRLQSVMQRYKQQSITPKYGIFKFDPRSNRLELLEPLPQCHHLKLFVMNKGLYMFRYGGTVKLMKWNRETKKFTLQQEYKQLPTSAINVVFCEQQNLMILMNIKYSGINDVYTLNLNNNTIEKVTVEMEHFSSNANRGYIVDRYTPLYRRDLTHLSLQLLWHQNFVIIVCETGNIFIYNIKEKQIRKSKIRLTAAGEPIILNNVMHLINENNHFAMDMKYIVPTYWLNNNTVSVVSEEKQMKNTETNTEKHVQQKSINIQLSRMENMINKMNSALTTLTTSMNNIENRMNTMETDVRLFKEKQKRDKCEIISMINNSKKDDDSKENDTKIIVKEWLRGFGLDRYYLCFVENGYESLQFIKGIGSKQELLEIGVELKGHQTQMMVQINILKGHNQDIEGQNVVDTHV